jgi:hypothetical protein
VVVARIVELGSGHEGCDASRTERAHDDYHFKPLNEHVQLYQRPFRIVQDVLIDAR